VSGRLLAHPHRPWDNPADAGQPNGPVCRSEPTTRRGGDHVGAKPAYVPAECPTDPRPPRQRFRRAPRRVRLLERSIVRKGIYPAVDPRNLASRAACRPEIVGEGARRIRQGLPSRCWQRLPRPLQTHRDFWRGTEHCPEEGKRSSSGPGKLELFPSASRFFVVEQCTGKKGSYVKPRLDTPARASMRSSSGRPTTCPTAGLSWVRSRRNERGPKAKEIEVGVDSRGVLKQSRPNPLGCLFFHEPEPASGAIIVFNIVACCERSANRDAGIGGRVQLDVPPG